MRLFKFSGSLVILSLVALFLVACEGLPTRGGDDDDSGVPGLDSDEDDEAGEDDDDAVDDDDSGDDDDSAGDDGPGGDDDDDDSEEVWHGPEGFVGSPCMSSADCDFDGGHCLLEGDGYPFGSCSLGCDLYCPDAEGHPMTFCVEADVLPSAAAALGDGACHSRCDLGLFPDSGCRPGYSCQVVARANESWTETYACLPGDEGDLNQCHFDLAARGLSFEPTLRAPTAPSTHPNLICEIEDPVWLHSPVEGVELLYYDGTPTDRVLASCEMAKALADTMIDVLPYDAVALRHIGTYNCRVISGTDTLSRHSFADAIDIYGFDFADGTSYTLIDDWVHDTTSTPASSGGAFLYDAAYRWHDDEIWNIILTPNYNAAHDNHFHVDLTPTGNPFIGFAGNYWIGPAPYVD